VVSKSTICRIERLKNEREEDLGMRDSIETNFKNYKGSIKKLTVLSLFDGGSGGQIAFDKLGVEFDGVDFKYYASEIKGHAIKVTKDNYPNTIHIGDVCNVSYSNGTLKTEEGIFEIGDVDILIGGSPCQDFSILNVLSPYKNKEMLGLNGLKSKLFYEYLRLLNEIKPKYFMLENVKMKKESEAELNEYLKCDGIHINSKLVSYQSRPRIYWSNVKIKEIQDKNIDFQDYKDMNFEY